MTTYQVGQKFSFTVGQSVICNGFPGWIKEVCTGQLVGMVVVQLRSGTTCTGANFPDVYPA